MSSLKKVNESSQGFLASIFWDFELLIVKKLITHGVIYGEN